jgi:hypothetical protein
MIPFTMIVMNKFTQRPPKVTLADGNDSIETLLFNRSDKPFGVGV